jgi:hypothetical protein
MDVHERSLPVGASLAACRARFRELPPLAPGELRGRFDGVVVGPRWYRLAFRALLVLGGLRGWSGKEFAASGDGVNLCRRRGRLRPVSRMRVAGEVASAVDGRPALLLRYRDLSPLRLIHDELRRQADGVYLGVTYAGLGPLRRLQLPFAIVRSDAPGREAGPPRPRDGAR